MALLGRDKLGVGDEQIIVIVAVVELLSHDRLFLPHGLWPARLLYAWDFPDKSTGVSCHVLLQGIFLTQGLNPLSPALAGRFLTTAPPGKPGLTDKNYYI